MPLEKFKDNVYLQLYSNTLAASITMQANHMISHRQVALYNYKN